MSTTPGTPTPQPASQTTVGWQWRWRIVHSLWLVFPVVGFGFLGGAAFIYLGLRTRRPAWWIPGIGYFALGLASVILIDPEGTTSTVGSWAANVLVIVWLASIVHAFLINRSWLRWRAARAQAVAAREAYIQAVYVAAASQPAPLAVPAVDPSEWAAPDGPPQAPMPWPLMPGPTALGPMALGPTAPGLMMPGPVPFAPPRRTRIPWRNRDQDVTVWAITPLVTYVIGALIAGFLFLCVALASALCGDNPGNACPSGSAGSRWFLNTALLFALGVAGLWIVPWWRGLRRLRYRIAAVIIILVALSPLALGVAYMNGYDVVGQ